MKLRLKEDVSLNVENLKDIIVIVPALHVLCCFIYLFFYYFAFGQGLAIFSSPVEVFSVSLSKIASLYLFFGIGLAIGNWGHESDSEIDEKYTEREAKRRKFAKNGSFYFIVAVSTFTAVTAIWAAFIDGYINWREVQFPFLLIMVYVFVRYANGNEILGSATHVGALILMTIGLISTSGLADGTDAAKLKMDLKEKRLPKCNDFYILKDVSDYLLALDNSENRYLLDKSCKPVFKFARPEDMRSEDQRQSLVFLMKYYNSE